VLYRELVSDALKKGRPLDISPLEVELLVCRAFHLTRARLWARRGERVSGIRRTQRFKRDLRRLLRNEPIDHILGKREFFSREFSVDRRVLVPRPDTEILVAAALERLRPGDHALEIGAGSGCIAITLALEAGLSVTALEIDPRAIRILRRNVRRHGVSERIDVIRGDLFPPRGGPWQAVISNPPYLSEAEWRELPEKIRRFEPKTALVAGENGLEFLERLVNESPPRLTPDGWLLLETGFSQAPAVAAIMEKAGYRSIQIIRDLAGIARVVAGRL